MRARDPAIRSAIGAALWLVLAAAPGSAQESSFGVLFDVRLKPTTRSASVRIRVSQSEGGLRGLRFRIDAERHRDFEGDGELVTGPDWVDWKPPRSGGSLRYGFRIDHLRDARSYDARCSEDWAVFRGDDLIPPAKATLREGAESRSRLRLRLPEGWSAATPYPDADDGSLVLDHPERRFDRPTGWMVAAKRMGTVRERIAGVSVTIAGPAGQGLRRLDILALLRWSLPSLRQAFAGLPERILVVGAGDPMWRGGLSGPRSLFIHADRPLLTPDATSPILHEMVHVALPLRAASGNDWIIEGLAELYSLEALVRSGTLGRRRYERALARLEREGREVSDLGVPVASGAVIGRAVSLLHDLDAEIRSSSGDARSLDDVVRALASEGGEVDEGRLRRAAEQVMGRSLEGFFRRRGLRR